MTVETMPQVVAQTEDRSLVFGTTEPSGIIVKATKIADSLVPLIEKKKLYKVIGPKKHVYVEGWNTMLAMLGVFPSLTHSIRLDRSEEIAYTARVELRHVSGVIVGAGEALCSSLEANWKNKDEFQISSMAQTRATGKAARLSFSWIMNLAGYAEVPAEEMTGTDATEREPIKPPVAKSGSVVTFVPAEVQVKNGEKDGKPWTKYGIKAPDGKVYGTFDENFGNLAQDSAKDKTEITVGWTLDKTGKYLNVVTLTPAANQ